MVRGFHQRSMQPELMDAEPGSFAEFHQCLKTLEVINRMALAYRPTLSWIRQFQNQPLAVLDAGSGGGDMLRRLARRHAVFSLTGVDLNPWARESAALSTPANIAIHYETADIFSYATRLNRVDVIISSLFTHHLDDGQLIHFLQWMDRTAQEGWFINDLHRHPLPYYFIKYAVRILSGNRMIRHDAPVSVARAFTRKDWLTFLEAAGIDRSRVQIRWFFPFRYCVSCRK